MKNKFIVNTAYKKPNTLYIDICDPTGTIWISYISNEGFKDYKTILERMEKELEGYITGGTLGE